MIDVELPLPSRNELYKRYSKHFDPLEKLLHEMQRRLRLRLRDVELYPTIKYRVKSFPSLYEKIIRRAKELSLKSGSLPLTDLLGMRVVCPFIEDLKRAERTVRELFDVIEVDRKGSDRSPQEFGYESTHYLIRVPSDLAESFHVRSELICEVQLRTILQDAWAEVEHELIYKAEFTPFDEPLRRKLAALNANLSLSDIIFQEIRDYQRQLQAELSRRRAEFWEQVNVRELLSTDALRAEKAMGLHSSPSSSASSLDAGSGSPGKSHSPGPAGGLHRAQGSSVPDSGVSADATSLPDPPGSDQSIDNMLLQALHEHNRKDLPEAIKIYSRILEFQPKPFVQSIIHIHRGMAYFTLEKYEEALRDFSAAVDLDASNWRAFYFRGITHRAQGRNCEALADLDRSCALDEYQYDTFFSRGRLHMVLGKLTEARADLERAIALEPDSDEVHHLLEEVLRREQQEGEDKA